MRDRLLPALGGERHGDVQRRDVQRLADELLGEGLDPSTVRNVLMPLRVIYRRAIEDGDLAVNPTSNLRLPAVRGRRERIASPEEAQQLLAALPERDRAVWATALYAGLRRGELMALRWDDVDLAQGVIHVERSYDEKARVEIEPKSRAGRRTVPIVGALGDELLTHKARERRDSGLVFGLTESKPFVTSNVWRRAQVAWRRAGLNPIGLHEARDTFASTLIAAGGWRALRSPGTTRPTSATGNSRPCVRVGFAASFPSRSSAKVSMCPTWTVSSCFARHRRRRCSPSNLGADCAALPARATSQSLT